MSEFAAIQDLFSCFAQALAAGDEASFRGRCLAAEADDELVALFRHNSARARAEGWSLKLREVVEEGPRASLTFEVRRPTGSERAQLEAERREGRWVLREM